MNLAVGALVTTQLWACQGGSLRARMEPHEIAKRAAECQHGMFSSGDGAHPTIPTNPFFTNDDEDDCEAILARLEETEEAEKTKKMTKNQKKTLERQEENREFIEHFKKLRTGRKGKIVKVKSDGDKDLGKIIKKMEDIEKQDARDKKNVFEKLEELVADDNLGADLSNTLWKKIFGRDDEAVEPSDLMLIKKLTTFAGTKRDEIKKRHEKVEEQKKAKMRAQRKRGRHNYFDYMGK